MQNFTRNVNILTALLLMAAGPWLHAQDVDSLPADTTVVIEALAPKGGIKITGQVVDAVTGNGLGGITIQVPGYSSGISDDKGAFSLYAPSVKTTVTVSGDGYHSKEVALKGRAEIAIKLHEENFRSIYGKSTILNTERSMTHGVNAVVSVNASGKFQTSSETPENYLQGKVPGLNMIRRSGTPGIGTFMSLRGVNSLYATHQPLVVVDGMIYDMNDYGGSLIQNYFSNPLSDIDIKDIDNVTVVKDAGSQFGSKGANGVIYITTSHAQDLATRINFSYYSGMNFTPSSYPVMDASQHRLYLSDILKTAGYSDADVEALPYMHDDPSRAGYYPYHNNTNWQGKVFKRSYNQNYHLRVTGGDNIAKYALMIGYADHKGIVDDTFFKRYSMRFNADLNISPRITGKANLSFTYGENKLVEEGLAPKTNPVFLSLVKSPMLHTNLISEEGLASPNLAEVDVFNVGNPSRILSNMSATNKNYRFFGSVEFRYKITEDLHASSLFGLTADKVRENLFIPKKGVIPDTLYNTLGENRMGAQLQRLFALYSDTRISYNKTFHNSHNISAKIGMRLIKNRSEEDFGLGFNSATDDFITIGTGVNALRRVGGELGKWGWLNYYATADYDFMNKYFVSFNIALDGSSRFGTEVSDGIRISGKPFGVFPSIGAAWLISSENFMVDANLIELLKIRVSYGVTGNDDIGNYNSRRFYSPQNFQGAQGLISSNIGNPQLQWETVKKLNAGMDVAVLDERLYFTVDAFRNTTSDMLNYRRMDRVTGFEYMLVNGGAMENTGVEVGVYGRILDNEVKVDLGLNISKYRNKLTGLLDGELETSYAGGTILSRVGQPVGLFYGYRTNGVFSSDEEAAASQLTQRDHQGNLISFRGGDMRFVDFDGNKIIEADDRRVIGDPNPDFTGMFSARVQWRKFTVDAQFTFSYGNELYNYTRAQLEAMDGFSNQTEVVVNRWRKNGQVTNMPRAEWGDPMGNARFSDRWIEDGSYLRFRTFSVTYDLPLKSSFFKNASVYCSGNNLFTITKYLGFDPEFSASNNVLFQGIDTGLIPQQRSVLLGVRVGL
jgi:TonB-linked SusC/RagA family outer membrane protein